VALPPALRERDFRLFVGGSFVSAVGGQLTTVAMAWQIYLLTDSALQVGLLGLARAVPQIAGALFGGMVADALDRRRVLAAVQVGTGLVAELGGARLSAVTGGLGALALVGAVALLPAVRRFRLPLPIAEAAPAAPAASTAVLLTGGRAP